LLCGFLIVVAMLASPWMKVSLHASFATFAVLLLWPLDMRYRALACVAAVGIAGSRLVLGRHTLADVLAGSLLGALFGACFWLVLRLPG